MDLPFPHTTPRRGCTPRQRESSRANWGAFLSTHPGHARKIAPKSSGGTRLAAWYRRPAILAALTLIALVGCGDSGGTNGGDTSMSISDESSYDSTVPSAGYTFDFTIKDVAYGRHTKP